jgi:hypothetical protein
LEFFRSSRYSGKYRPAWRISQNGGLSRVSPRKARIISFWSEGFVIGESAASNFSLLKQSIFFL